VTTDARKRSPTTNLPLANSTLTANNALRTMAREWLAQTGTSDELAMAVGRACLGRGTVDLEAHLAALAATDAVAPGLSGVRRALGRMSPAVRKALEAAEESSARATVARTERLEVARAAVRAAAALVAETHAARDHKVAVRTAILSELGEAYRATYRMHDEIKAAQKANEAFAAEVAAIEAQQAAEQAAEQAGQTDARATPSRATPSRATPSRATPPPATPPPARPRKRPRTAPATCPLFVEAKVLWHALESRKIDSARARVLATVSAERGSPDALAWCTAEGWGRPADRAAAISMMQAAVEGDAPSPYTMCHLAELLGQTDAARELLTRAASLDCALGHHRLALWGRGAVHMQRAADLGMSAARCELATMLDFGELNGTDNDVARANELYVLAAAQGDVTAMFNLAVSYMDGSCGREANPRTAARWMLAAAQAGDVVAAAKYGRMCMTGTGVGKDERSGRTWLCRASDQGDASATKMLRTMVFD
jgi:TPR repeat protein